MLKALLLSFLGLSIMSFAQNNSKVNITFTVRTKTLPKGSNIFISGSSQSLGNWQPDRVPLEKAAEDIWATTISFSRGETIEFKFTLGRWENEALNSDGTIPLNHVLVVNNDTTVIFSIDSWKAGEIKQEARITGTVEYHKNFKGEGINQRDVIVWLPPDYDVNASMHYPVLYMHDGQNIVDPATSSFGVDWGADETADSLIKSGEMQSIIIVGIYNTKDRNAEYSYTEKGYAYMRFIVEKLKPFIDKTYRTLPGRENTATMGSSMGGLISLMLVWEYPHVFSKAACLSPAFKIHQLNYLPYIEKYAGPKKKLKIYIDNGGIALEAQLRPGIDDAINALKAKGYKEGDDLEVFFDISAEHNEKAWAKRLWRPMKFLFGNK